LSVALPKVVRSIDSPSVAASRWRKSGLPDNLDGVPGLEELCRLLMVGAHRRARYEPPRILVAHDKDVRFLRYPGRGWPPAWATRSRAKGRVMLARAPVKQTVKP
jgi:hypothetical protein